LFGVRTYEQTDSTGIAAAVAAVKLSDAAVIVAGLDPSIEYEMRDRTNLLLPGVQPALVAAVVKAAAAEQKPVVLVIMAGGVVDVTPELTAGVDAVLWVGYPGQSGGQALAEIIFGDVAPSGRAPLTWYKNADFADGSPSMVNMFDMGMRPNATTKNPGRTCVHHVRNMISGIMCVRVRVYVCVCACVCVCVCVCVRARARAEGTFSSFRRACTRGYCLIQRFRQT
jgi:hypothetical protein